jgi:hypothetical protein
LRKLRLTIGGMGAAALLLAIGTASAFAQAGSVVVSSESPFADGTHEIFHTCKVIGGPVGGVEAVHCADLFQTQIPGEPVEWSAENEVLCQTTGGALRECAGIHERPEIATIANGKLSTFPGAAGVCGVRFGHSACGVRRVINASPGLQFVTSGHLCPIWGVSLAPSVVLPGSGVTVSAGNLATPHATANC